ncbi:hypothetical protein BD410DRAFT_93919 [Rickenella mellea]|uniref:Uncharacterized protein n=1 Tax=Rickenella mellea TaxID=50990 RepID=A0A4Y7QCH6_9AGAM|nr:hypothetical protein BD410DRAFT_93919 [Rickenella mellea]
MICNERGLDLISQSPPQTFSCCSSTSSTYFPGFSTDIDHFGDVHGTLLSCVWVCYFFVTCGTFWFFGFSRCLLPHSRCTTKYTMKHISTTMPKYLNRPHDLRLVHIITAS